jgi:UPF0176 protein
MSSNTLTNYVNLSAYKFVNLNNLDSLREDLRACCKALDLKGTILLSSEGFNLFISGEEKDISKFEEEVRRLLCPDFYDFKRSLSEKIPFKRLLIKIKKEIISFGQDNIDPAAEPAPRVSPAQLKQWLDEGQAVTLLDTRNDYEIRLGKFNNAIVLEDLHHFRDFPEKIAKLSSTIKESKVVSYCTGGIRCEKAAPFLKQQGFKEVYQLDGGILRYFEECGDAHYTGDCFVFDYRVALNSHLQECDTVQCFACRMPVTVEEQQEATYIIEKSCPHCYATQQAEQHAENTTESCV